MSLWVTLIIVTVGISGIVALVHFTVGSERVRLKSKAEVLAMWDNEFSNTIALGALLEPSGWCHNGTRKTSGQIKADHAP